MTRNCSVTSFFFASAQSSTQISRNLFWTINRLQKLSRNQSQRWSKLSNLPCKHTITPLKFILPTDQSSPSSTLGTWFLLPRCRNPRIYHWPRGRSCSTGDLVRRRYRRPQSGAFTWSTKSGSKTSSEARERSTSPNRIKANSFIASSHSCSRCANRTLRLCTSMKLCSHSVLSERRDGRTTETEFASTIQNCELPL